MALEHISKPFPLMEICPKNSRYAMRWDSEGKQFLISYPKHGKTLFTLDYDVGRYVYMMLRAQQRIEEAAAPESPARRGLPTKDMIMESMGKSPHISEAEKQMAWQQIAGSFPGIPDEHKDPAITHRRALLGQEMFAYVEDDEVRTGMDREIRKKNIIDECFDAVREYMRFAGLEPIEGEMAFKESPGYDELERESKKLPYPQFVEVAYSDPTQHGGAMTQAHAFIALKEADGEIVCFEKVGGSLPWRLTTLREINDMYERDFKNANKGRPKVYWTVNRLPKKA